MESALEVLIPGGIAGFAANGLCHPLDSLKTRMLQLNKDGSRRYSGIIDAIRKISATDGLRSLYRGYATVMLTTVPGNMAYFASYELSVALTTSLLPVSSDSVIGQSISGIPAQLLASFAYTPIDIVKERLQTRQVGPRVVVSEIYNATGLFGFMRGFTASAALWAPYGAIYLASYQMFKNMFGSAEGPSALGTLACSMVSAAIAATLTTPIDVVKINLQLRDDIKSASGLAMDLIRTRGIRYMFKGASSRVLYLGPRTGISFATYDIVKRWRISQKQKHQQPPQ